MYKFCIYCRVSNTLYVFIREILCITVLICCYIMNFHQMDYEFNFGRYGNYREMQSKYSFNYNCSFIPRISLACNIYVTPLLACLINALKIENAINLRVGQEDHFKKISGRRILNVYHIGIIAFITMLFFDIFFHGSKYSVIFWLCIYLPGTIISSYFNEVSCALNTLKSEFKAINGQLQCCTKFGEMHVQRLNSIFQRYSNNCQAVEINNVKSGCTFLILLGTAFCIWLSAFYGLVIYLLHTIQGRPLNKSVYACDFWAWIYLIVVIMYIEENRHVEKISTKISTILHNISNMNPEIDEWVSLPKPYFFLLLLSDIELLD